MKKAIALALAVLFIILPLSSCGRYDPENDTLIIATDTFGGRFNPFYAESEADREVLKQIFTAPGRQNASNEMTDWAGSITCEEKTADGGAMHIIYTVKLKKGMKFSDGTPVTIDDLLYSYYVLADPGYSGPACTWATSTSIVGLKEYYYDDPGYSEKLAGFETEAAQKYSAETISENDFIAYLVESGLDGWWTGEPSGDIGDGATTWSDYIEFGGFGDELAGIDAADPQAMLNLLARVEYTNYADYYDPYTYYLEKLKEQYRTAGLEDGVDVETISGIVRVDDLTCTVEFYAIDIYGDHAVNQPIVPAHYYGAVEKGGADEALLKNLDSPMGSGPYIWVNYADSIVSVKANDAYYEGEPFIKHIKWQYIAQDDLIACLKNGTVDIARPDASADSIKDLTESELSYSLVDNNGYAYLGINADLVDKKVRQGIMYLLNREPAIKSFYGDLAQVIERPLTTTLAEYPDGAQEYYGYDPDKALACFVDAGYSQTGGKLVKDGRQLSFTAYIGGEGTGDHAGYAMLVQAQNDLEALGGELIIQDVQLAVLQDAVYNNTADIFVLAWGEFNTCDKTTVYKTGAGQNFFNLANRDIDTKLDEILKTVDLKERSALVAAMLNKVMEEAVEMPLYQRKNMIAYNPGVVDIKTLPETTTYWDYSSQLWKLKLK